MQACHWKFPSDKLKVLNREAVGICKATYSQEHPQFTGLPHVPSNFFIENKMAKGTWPCGTIAFM